MALSESGGAGRFVSFMTPSTTSETDYTGKVVAWVKNTTTYSDSGIILATTSDKPIGVGCGKVREVTTAATGKVTVQVSGIAYADCEAAAEIDEGAFVIAGTSGGLALQKADPTTGFDHVVGRCAVSNKTYTGTGTTSTIATTVVVQL